MSASERMQVDKNRSSGKAAGLHWLSVSLLVDEGSVKVKVKAKFSEQSVQCS